MWYTTSRYVSPIIFPCVSLTSCAVGHHSTSDSGTGRPCRGGSLFAGKWQQCEGTGQCGLTKGNSNFLWSSNVVSWSLYSSDSSSNPMRNVAQQCCQIALTFEVLDEALQMNCHAQGTFFTIANCDVIEAHCYVVDIGRTDRNRNVAESITTDAGRFCHIGLCQLRTFVA